MKKKYVKIMFLSLSLLTISTTATYAVQPEDDKKENEALQTSTEEHLPLLTINGTNASSSFIVNSEALLGKEITITAPNGFTVTPTVIAANSGKQKVKRMAMQMVQKSLLKMQQMEIIIYQARLLE